MRLTRIAVAMCSVALFASCKPGRQVSTGGPALKNVSAGTEDRVGVGITVLNDNLALVRETRRVDLQEGRQVLSFVGVSDEIIPESVRVTASKGEHPLFFEEQNYDTDLVAPERIIEKGIGAKVRVYAVNSATGEEEEVQGTLLSGSKGILIETGEGVREVSSGARIEMDEVPRGLLSEPVLSWITGAQNTGGFEIEAIYLTRGISWRADYIIDVDQIERKARVQAWATIDNRTALALENAGLQLLAGEVNVLKQVMVETFTGAFDAMKAEPAAPPMPKEEALFEYHLYTVERPLDIRARQQKQIALASADGVAFAVTHKMRPYLAEQTIEDLPTAVVLEIEHAEGTPLGVPLPAGRAAVWTEDKGAGRRLQVGEVEVDHTPVGEPLKIELPNDPAVRGKWTPIRARWNENGRFLVQGALEVRNNHSAPTRLEIEVSVPGSLDITLVADGEEVPEEDAGAWKIAVELEPNQLRTIAIQTRF
jgi:hypothetical protein